MGKLLYLGLFLASLDPTYEPASDNARRALLETEMMKHELKCFQDSAEKELYNYTGLTKDDLVYAVYAYPLAAGKVSTKPIKNFKYETKDKWTFRPEIEYGIWNKQTTIYFGLTKEF